MELRLIGYLAFLWGNVVLGWAVLGGNLFLRGWWLLLLSAMTSISLVALTSTDPGRITASESGEQQLCPVARGRGHLAQQQQQQYLTQQMCTLCNNAKPARAHHCRMCNRCVLKMDHHCHWIGRCVGAGNYKAYLLTLLYACVSSGAMLVVLWRQSWTGRAIPDWMGFAGFAGLLLNGVLLMFVFCSVSYLLVWHGYLTAGNITTIEYFKWKRSVRNPRQYHLSPRARVRLSDFDGGLLFNVREALGQECWLWLWPGVGQDGWSRLRYLRCCCSWGGRSEGGGVVIGDGEQEPDAGVVAWLPGAAKWKIFMFAIKNHWPGSASPLPVAQDDGDDDRIDDSTVGELKGLEMSTMRGSSPRMSRLAPLTSRVGSSCSSSSSPSDMAFAFRESGAVVAPI